MEHELKRMGDLKVGDMVIGPDSKPTRVTEAYDEHIPERMYRLEMDNGEIVEVSGNHLWYCENDRDREDKRTYKRLAKKFFKKHSIPEKDPLNPAFPVDVMLTKFPDDKSTKEFIDRACASLGPSNSTPMVTFDGYMEIVDDHLIFSISYNDLIDFLFSMKEAVLNKNGYFFFGKVRTTDEIFSIIGTNVNIPTKSELDKEYRKD